MIEFWLKNESYGVALLLPVTPSDYSIGYGSEIEIVRGTGVGDINIPGYITPSSITIRGFFPKQDYPFVKKGTLSLNMPMDYVLLIKKWIKDKAIMRFIVADQTGVRINEQFYIENIDYGESNEDNGDITYTIKLRQYIPLKASTIQDTSEKNTARSDGKTPEKPKSYTVEKGDSLSKIARYVYGDASQWKKIYEANQDIIGKNPNLIFPGQSYTIP
jgi:hypothetical protein